MKTDLSEPETKKLKFLTNLSHNQDYDLIAPHLFHKQIDIEPIAFFDTSKAASVAVRLASSTIQFVETLLAWGLVDTINIEFVEINTAPIFKITMASNISFSDRKVIRDLVLKNGQVITTRQLESLIINHREKEISFLSLRTFFDAPQRENFAAEYRRLYGVNLNDGDLEVIEFSKVTKVLNTMIKR